MAELLLHEREAGDAGLLSSGGADGGGEPQADILRLGSCVFQDFGLRRFQVSKELGKSWHVQGADLLPVSDACSQNASVLRHGQILPVRALLPLFFDHGANTAPESSMSLSKKGVG